MESMSKTYTLDEVCSMLGYASKTVYKMGRTGVIKKIAMGKYEAESVDSLAVKLAGSYTFRDVLRMTGLSRTRIGQLHSQRKLRKILTSRYVKEDVDKLVADLNERRKL
jgi:predicted DNA-binding transcriptional regulator AlpA